MLTARMRALGYKTEMFGRSFQNPSGGGSQPRIRVQLSPIGRQAQLLSAGGRSLRCRSHSNDSLSGSGGAEDDYQSNPLPDAHSGSGPMADGEGRGETVRPAASTSGGLHPEMAEASSFGTLSESRMGSQMEMVLQLEAAKLRALEDYRQHLQLGDDDVDLLKGAVLIAKHRYPHLREEAVRARVDELAGAVRKQLPESAYPMRILQDISRVLYQQMGFAGNKDDYYNMDNSCINKVLEERKGIPISLSVVFMEVAARLGVPMAGVGLPFHFMIRPLLPEVEVLVDAFNGGEVCFLEDAEDRLSEISRMKIKLDARFVRDAEPLSSRLVLYRMLTNIKQLYIAARRPQETLRIVRYMRATVSQPNDIRDEALCLYALDEHEECAQLLQEYLQEAPDANDAADVQQLIDRLKQL